MIRTTGGTAAQQRVNAQQQIEVQNEQFNATHAGSLTALVRVGTDGKPGSQIRVLEVTNPSAKQYLGDRIDAVGSCRPGISASWCQRNSGLPWETLESCDEAHRRGGHHPPSGL